MKKTYIIAIAIITIILSIYMPLNKKEEVSNSVQQEIIESKIDDSSINIEKYITQINNSTEIILLDEQGTSNITYSRSSNKFFKWLTTSNIQISVNYHAILSIPTDDILIVHDGNKVIVKFNPTSIKVKAIEITNKNILRDNDILGKEYNDNEIIVLEKMLIDDIRGKLLSTSNIESAVTSLQYYLSSIAEDFDVKIKFNLWGDDQNVHTY